MSRIPICRLLCQLYFFYYPCFGSYPDTPKAAAKFTLRQCHRNDGAGCGSGGCQLHIYIQQLSIQKLHNVYFTMHSAKYQTAILLRPNSICSDCYCIHHSRHCEQSEAIQKLSSLKNHRISLASAAWIASSLSLLASDGLGLS